MVLSVYILFAGHTLLYSFVVIENIDKLNRGSWDSLQVASSVNVYNTNRLANFTSYGNTSTEASVALDPHTLIFCSDYFACKCTCDWDLHVNGKLFLQLRSQMCSLFPSLK